MTTLQEYLVKLGWSVDEPSFKKFMGALASTGARTAELGATAVETAAAIELMVTRVARNYESLYYMSQRTGQSVQYIQRTQFAFKQIGLSAEEANESIEGIATTLRTQPWLKAIFGGANTPQQVATNLGRSGLPYFLQVKFAEMIGMSEKTLFHMQKFASVEAAAEEDLTRRQRAAGLDPDTLAKQSAAYGRELNKLESDLGIFGTRMAADFLGPTGHGIVLLDEFVQGLSKVDVATKGWLSTLVGLAGAAGGVIVLGKALKWMFELKANPGKSLLKGGGIIGAALAALEMVKTDDPEQKEGLREMLGPILYKLGLSKSPDLTQGGVRGNHFRPAGRSKFPGGSARDRIYQAVEFFKSQGYPDEAAKGMAAGLYSENTAMDPSKANSIGMTGIAQWDTQRRAKFKQLYGKDIGAASFDEQLKYIAWELDNTEKTTGASLRQRGLNSRDAASTFIHGYERPGSAGEASDMSRAGPLAAQLSGLVPQQSGDTNNKNVTLHSKTDIHIQGAPDMMSTAKQYTDAHNDVNDNLIRNLTATVR